MFFKNSEAATDNKSRYTVYMGIDPYKRSDKSEFAFEGSPADKYCREAIIRLQRRRCMFRVICLILAFLVLGAAIVGAAAKVLKKQQEKAVLAELGFNPEYISNYYIWYVRTEWYNSVSDTDIDPYNMQEIAEYEHEIFNAFVKAHGYGVPFDRPEIAYTAVESREAFEQRYQNMIDEAEAKIAREFEAKERSFYPIGAALILLVVGYIIFFEIFSPVLRRMKNSELMITDGWCECAFFGLKKHSLTFYFKGSNVSDEFYQNISVTPINMPFSEIMEYKIRTNKVRVTAVRMEPDLCSNPKAYIYPSSMIKRIEQKLKKKYGVRY